MRRFGLAIAVTVAAAAATSASAADLRMPVKAPVYAPAPAYTLWNGFYIGANVGYGAGVEDTGVLRNNTADLNPAFAAGVIPTNFGIQRDGIVGGGQIGYNYQAGNIVFGVEADFQGSGINGRKVISTTGIVGFIPATSTGTSDLNWFGTVRGRIGVAFDRALLYATGGFAYGGVEDSAELRATVAPPPDFFGRRSQTLTGYTVGGGLEYAFSPNWSLKAEYLYVDLGNTSVVLTDPASPASSATYSFDHRYHVGRIGINYKFGAPVVASY